MIYTVNLKNTNATSPQILILATPPSYGAHFNIKLSTIITHYYYYYYVEFSLAGNNTIKHWATTSNLGGSCLHIAG